MSECSSCGAGRPIIIHCCGSGAPAPTSPPDGAPPPPPKDPPSAPPAEPPCKDVVVRFESIQVTNSGAAFDFADEPWNVFLDANGNSATVTNPLQTQDDEEFSLGAGGEATVSLNAATVIRVQCSGVANPGVPFFETPLPSDIQSHGSADNWGLGGSFELVASNADRGYKVRYSIDCLTQVAASLISRSLAIATVREALKTLDDRDKVSDDVALSLFMGKISRHGFRVKGLHAADLLIEGPTDIHRFLSRLRKPLVGRRRAASK